MTRVGRFDPCQAVFLPDGCPDRNHKSRKALRAEMQSPARIRKRSRDRSRLSIRLTSTAIQHVALTVSAAPRATVSSHDDRDRREADRKRATRWYGKSFSISFGNVTEKKFISAVGREAARMPRPRRRRVQPPGSRGAAGPRSLGRGGRKLGAGLFDADRQFRGPAHAALGHRDGGRCALADLGPRSRRPDGDGHRRSPMRSSTRPSTWISRSSTSSCGAASRPACRRSPPEGLRVPARPARFRFPNAPICSNGETTDIVDRWQPS